MSLRLSILVCILSGSLLLAGCSTEEKKEVEQVDLNELLNAEGTVKRDLTLKSSALGRTMKYSLWLPPSYKPGGAFPFLYLLHGYGDNNNAWLDNGRAQAIAKDYYRKYKVPVVIVMPDGLVSFYTDDWERYFHEELMPEVEKNYCCNGKRAVAGLSMGGYGTLYNVLNHPDKFTCGYAMSPATSYGSVSLEELVKAQSDPSVFPHITLESGTEDSVVSIASVRAFASMLEGYGVPYDLIERSGGHDWTFWPVCLEKALVKAGQTF